MSKHKSLFEAIRELIDAYDTAEGALTEPVKRGINALRPYLFAAEETLKRYARTEPFPSLQGDLPLKSI